LKELEDYKWFPSVLRNFQTEFIGYMVLVFDVYDVFVDYLNKAHLPKRPMKDLCSGSGEPAISIFNKSTCFNSLSLSDKFPNTIDAGTCKILNEIHEQDVLSMDFKNNTCYTMFNAFHHFSDGDKLKISQRIQQKKAVAFFVEMLEPTLLCFLKVLFITIMGSLLFTPFIKPFSYSRLIFTYLIPINLFTITFDGLLSVVKSRSIKQYQQLFSNDVRPVKVFRLQRGLSSLVVIQLGTEK
jgi:ubiquinone/menaquinone biosynthesis C-methylase UbiE